jgi:glycine betaine catabolism B
MSILSTRDLTFTESREEDGGVTVFAFRPRRPLPHTAGQHGLLTVPNAGTKAFSLASAPEEVDVLIGTHLQSGSAFKKALAALRPGDDISIRGPILNFTLAGAAPQVVLLAQGVGITPFRSILVHLAAIDPDRDTTLVHVGQGHAFRNESQRLARTAVFPTDRDGFQLETKRAVGRHPTATFYLSGTGTFIKAAAEQLKDLGVPRRHIKKDQFLGY